MFSKCCGCNNNNDISKNEENPDGIQKKKENPDGNDVKGDTSMWTIELPILSTIEEHDEPIVLKQPKTTSNSDSKRQSVISDIKIEVSDNDDDVFCEGVGPPIKLAENLGNPSNKASELPKWFSDDEEVECDGIQEPPATPVGRDELALRRHRFFSELLTAAQNANEHKVRFDPMGPVVAGGELMKI